MRTLINVVVILGIGVLVGVALRSFRGTDIAEESELGVAAHVSDLEPTRPAGVDDESLQRVGEKPEAVEGWMTQFELTERSGETLASTDLVGQPYVASFFFSTCPSVCKLQNEKMQQLQTLFEGKDVRFLAISVDPEVDTPEVLREYAQRYKADEDQWLFLTGDLGYIRRVGGEVFGVAVDQKFHTEKFILVNRDGDVVGYYTWTDQSQFDRLKKDIEKLLLQG